MVKNIEERLQNCDGRKEMRATIVLLADDKLSNIGSKLLYKANKIADVGYEMTRLPFHVSLKQPFVVKDLETIEKFFDEFSKEFCTIEIQFEEFKCYQSKLGGIDTGCISIKTENQALRNLQKRLLAELKSKFGDCPAEYDNDYMFHMTVAIGKANYSNYEKAYEILKQEVPNGTFILDKIALFIYNNIIPGTYFCYKIFPAKSKNISKE